MASPGSSADEGEIVEGRETYKAKTSFTGAAASTSTSTSAFASTHSASDQNRLAGDDSGTMEIQSVDRRNRLHPFHRNTSPRGLKRRAGAPERFERGDRYNDYNGGGSYDRDRRDRRDYDRQYDRQYDRRDDRRDDRRNDRDSRDSRDSRASRDRRGELRYDDYDDSRPTSGKRQRTRSRSPALSVRSITSNGTNGNRGRNDRDQRDRDQRDRRDRDREIDRNRDRDYRNDRDRVVRPDRDQARRPNGQNGSNGTNGQSGQRNGHSEKSSVRKDNLELFVVEPPPPPPIQEVSIEQTPVDEDAEIERRRKRREEILRKSRASTPLIAAAGILGDKLASSIASPATPHTPATPATDGVSPRSQAEESLNLANDQDFINMLGKQNAGNTTGSPAAEDGPSAADYDPTADMEEDERRDELRNGGTVAGLHGGDRRESLAAPAENPTEAEQAKEEPKADDINDDDDDDEDDMFAEDFVEKKYETSKDNAASTADGADGALPTAAANGGGILEGDDLQGYYKIRRGEILDGRYQIQSTLGKGMFSGVARAWDISTPERREVAIKMMRNNDALRKGGYTEIAILQKLNEADPESRKHIVQFERYFEFRGHLCMVFENLSMNLREVLKKFGNNVGINLHGVRVYAYQIFVALAHMRRCSIVHADLKPDNILVNENRSTLKICDLGTAIDRSDAATAHTEITPYLVSRFYRAPEIILGLPYDYGVDMWSIGCTLYELYTGKILFTGESNNQMLRAIVEIRGKLSAKQYRRGDLWRMHFDDNGGFFSYERDKFSGKTTIKTLPVIKPTRDLRTRLVAASAGMSDAESKELGLFHDLLDRCLSLNPDKRIQPADALKHPFFTKK